MHTLFLNLIFRMARLQALLTHHIHTLQEEPFATKSTCFAPAFAGFVSVGNS